VLRFFQGQGNGIVQFCSYTIITGLYQDELLLYMSYIELAVGLGFGLGPTIGGILSPYLHYQFTMYFFGGLTLIGMAICYFLMPKKLNQVDTLVSARNDSYRHPNYEKYSKIGWPLLLKNRHSVFALLICFFGIFNMTFFQSFLTVEIQK
jgi:MFS family permease